jgi:AraC-like DNA-binding protein
LQLNVGLSAGSPVTGQNDLFGEAVQMARWLCLLAGGDKVVVSSEVNDLLITEGINGLRQELCVEALTPSDEMFLTRFAAITEAAWNEPALDIDKYCREIGMSRSQFYRKTTSLTGHSPNDFLRTYRLTKALKLLEKRHDSISEVAFKAGFGSPSYFSKCFKKQYGVLPSALSDR